MIPAIAQLTLGKALELLSGWSRQADDIGRTISEANGRLITADRNADGISDPTARAAAKASIKKLVARQASIVAKWRQVGGLVNTFRTKLRDWMRSLGLSIPSGLGAVPIVPLAIAGAVLLIVAGMHELGPRAQANLLEVKNKAAAIELLRSRPGAAADAQSLAKLLEDTTPDGDPFGLDAILKQLGPIAMLIAAAFIVPPLLRARGRA